MRDAVDERCKYLILRFLGVPPSCTGLSHSHSRHAVLLLQDKENAGVIGKVCVPVCPYETRFSSRHLQLAWSCAFVLHTYAQYGACFLGLSARAPDHVHLNFVKAAPKDTANTSMSSDPGPAA